MEETPRLNFGQFVDKIFWVLILFLANRISQEANSINKSIQILNEKMAAIVTTVANQDKRLDGIDSRINRLEEKGLLPK
jgi:hypothetical protein